MRGVGAPRLRCECQGAEKAYLTEQSMIAGCRRQDADDLERLIVAADDTADDIRRGGETVAPERHR